MEYFCKIGKTLAIRIVITTNGHNRLVIMIHSHGLIGGDGILTG